MPIDILPDIWYTLGTVKEEDRNKQEVEKNLRKIKKTLDKPFSTCYNKATVKEGAQRKMNNKMVDFKLLIALANEYGNEYPIENTIAVMAMCDIPMTDAVIQLGIVTDILLPDYHNGWSQEKPGITEV